MLFRSVSQSRYTHKNSVFSPPCSTNQNSSSSMNPSSVSTPKAPSLPKISSLTDSLFNFSGLAAECLKNFCTINLSVGLKNLQTETFLPILSELSIEYISSPPYFLGYLNRIRSFSQNAGMTEKKRGQVPFFGLPLVRSVDSSPSLSAILLTHSLSPNGDPRFKAWRIFSNFSFSSSESVFAHFS